MVSRNRRSLPLDEQNLAGLYYPPSRDFALLCINAPLLRTLRLMEARCGKLRVFDAQTLPYVVPKLLHNRPTSVLRWPGLLGGMFEVFSKSSENEIIVPFPVYSFEVFDATFWKFVHRRLVGEEMTVLLKPLLEFKLFFNFKPLLKF
ncbi:uncharacterized protein L3040_000508 [Drepanopeziza brunnea f. sp. 'multigermtubi']|uniref:uncharacterized protein n=1 Tax=Drepanopeziza brunnea f. sp. 'multigermtubi' TaxID=698441 RepID=UPI0023993F2C|nr:hypothetical protein L3040_000508 [Drepanopeziza brunnea f. sp. 'multigermtubi']